jgi:hypothetical protein
MSEKPVEDSVPVTCSCGVPGTAIVTRSCFVADPTELERIVSGRFNRYKCAHCGVTTNIAAEILVFHETADWVVYLVSPANVATTGAQLHETFKHARARVVTTRLDLMEKARALGAGLDDVALAIVKELRWATMSEADRACTLWFDRLEENQLVFVAIDKTGVRGNISVSRDAFEKVKVMYATATHREQLSVDSELAKKLIGQPRRPS